MKLTRAVIPLTIYFTSAGVLILTVIALLLRRGSLYHFLARACDSLFP